MIDGWRFDALTEKVTPNIFRFSERALRFSDHLSGRQRDTHRYLRHVLRHPRHLLARDAGRATWPAVRLAALRDSGYDVSIFAAAKLNNPEFDRTVFADVPDLRLRSEGASPSERDLRTSPQDFF